MTCSSLHFFCLCACSSRGEQRGRCAGFLSPAIAPHKYPLSERVLCAYLRVSCWCNLWNLGPPHVHRMAYCAALCCRFCKVFSREMFHREYVTSLYQSCRLQRNERINDSPRGAGGYYFIPFRIEEWRDQESHVLYRSM